MCYCVTPCRTPSLHTGMNLFVCNMAVSDTVMCLTAAPLTPITSFTGRWFLGHIPCLILPACQVDDDNDSDDDGDNDNLPVRWQIIKIL